MKRFFLALAMLVCVGLPLALGAAAMLMLQDQALVKDTAEFSPADVAHAKQTLQRYDPRRAPPGVLQADGLRTLELPAADLDRLAHYLMSRTGRGHSRITLRQGELGLEASIALPHNPLGRYLNIRAVLHETAGLPEFKALKLGRLPVPAWLAGLAARQVLPRLTGPEGYQLAADTVRSVGIAAAGLQIRYRWRDDLVDRLRQLALPAVERERLQVYQERLARLSADTGRSGHVSLTRLLVPLMNLARERSAGNAPLAEHRALIAVLAFYVNGQGWERIIPDAASWKRAAPRLVTLRGRHDLAQHFIVSAGIAAFAGTPLADAVGLEKELEDSRGGSGFSFDDLAADRAGTVFGQRATGDGWTALQHRVAAGVSESDLMPDVSGLPSFMPEAEFQRRFGGVGAPPYLAMMQEIERRVAACALYR